MRKETTRNDFPLAADRPETVTRLSYEQRELAKAFAMADLTSEEEAWAAFQRQDRARIHQWMAGLDAFLEAEGGTVC